MGAIDEEALASVSFIANLSKHIQMRESQGSSPESETPASMPAFLWVLRDFVLSLEDEVSLAQLYQKKRTLSRVVAFVWASLNRVRYTEHPMVIPLTMDVRVFKDLLCASSQDGNTMSPKEYLEQSLQLQNGFSSDVQQRNRIRSSLTEAFRVRDCFTLVRPLDEEEDLQRMDSVGAESLRPEFNTQMEILDDHIFNKVRHVFLVGRLGVSVTTL